MAGTLPYLTAKTIRELLTEHGIKPSKALGQNFLADANHVRRICSIADVKAGDQVIEIGPGLGSLTIGLLNAGARVITVEKDRRFAGILAESAPGAEVVVADALGLGRSFLKGLGGDSTWKLVANLPYSVATRVFLHLLENLAEIASGVVMLQREVGERLVAVAGEAAYGVTSILTAYWVEARLAGYVPASVFVPRPKVDSVLVAFERRVDINERTDREMLFALVKAGFSTRRKTLRNAIRSLDWAGEAGAACDALGIDPRVRAEELSLEEFRSIVRHAEGAPRKAGR